jgi:hypothetical protein
MKKYFLLISVIWCNLFSQIPSQYHSYNDLTKALQKVSKESPIVTLESIAKTINGKDIWAVTINKGVPVKKAILVVGGIEATSLVGSEHALRFIQHLAQSYGTVDSITRVLDNTTLYIIPRANPDAIESFFVKPIVERETNSNPYDDDRDAAVDEDDVDDLNKDGIISWMRIKDPRGEWIIHPDDARLMRKAETAKGEHGMYRLYSEGIDNDNDEEWNEDGIGGTDLNRNFTYNYQFFGARSGVHQISERESKAIADFVFDRPNIGLIFTFSSNDNLTVPWKNEPPKGESQTITSVTKEDEEYYGVISKKFTEITSLTNAPKPAKGEGAFSDWAYYHAGRWSFAVRPWWAGNLSKQKDSTALQEPKQNPADRKTADKVKTDDPAIKTLQWYDAIGTKEISVPWTTVKHPDFPDQTVEIGGVKPFVLNNPPAESINAYSKTYSDFITYLAQQLPSIAISNQKVEKISDNVFRITVDVVNNGFLPTNNSIGVKSRWIRNVRVQITSGKGSTISSGKTQQILEPIKGLGGCKTVSWVVVGKGSVSVTADSPVAGAAELKIELK